MKKRRAEFQGITLGIARKHLEEWLEAELELTTHQSYRLGNESLTRADLGEVRRMVQFWSDKVTALERAQRSGGRNRIYHVVPRDY